MHIMHQGVTGKAVLNSISTFLRIPLAARKEAQPVSLKNLTSITYAHDDAKRFRHQGICLVLKDADGNTQKINGKHLRRPEVWCTRVRQYATRSGAHIDDQAHQLLDRVIQLGCWS